MHELTNHNKQLLFDQRLLLFNNNRQTVRWLTRQWLDLMVRGPISLWCNGAVALIYDLLYYDGQRYEWSCCCQLPLLRHITGKT